MNAQNLRKAADILTNAINIPVQALGLDLDGTIDENPHFFGLLSRLWPGKVYVITYRNDRTQTEKDLSEYGIHYDEVVLVNTFSQKAAEIKRLEIGIYIDDMDEVITHIPETVTVLKVRNGGNFEDNKWLYSDKTGRRI